MTESMFIQTPDGDYVCPQTEYVPGLFVEVCKPGEDLPSLTPDELADILVAESECAWHGIGFEAGRQYYRVSFRANVGDVKVMDFRTWKLGERPPDDSYHKWAVEFPLCNKPGFVRRFFWFQSKHPVPDTGEFGKALLQSGKQNAARKELARRDLLQKARTKRANEKRATNGMDNLLAGY